MESDRMDAAASLEMMARARRNAEKVIQQSPGSVLWAALVISIYVGLTVLFYSDATSTWSGRGVMVMLPALIAFTGLSTGLAESLGFRTRAGATHTIIAVLATVVILGVAWFVGTFGSGYPWWIGAVCMPIVYVVLTARTVLALRRTGFPARSETAVEGRRLRGGVRIVTIGLGVMLALLIATAPFELVSPIVGMVCMLALVVVLVAMASPWGLSSVGIAWGRVHWVAFLTSCGLLLVPLVVGFFRQGIPPVLALACGTAITALMTFAACRAKGRS